MSKYTTELRNVVENYGREEVESWFKDYCLFDYLTKEQVEVINKTNIWNQEKLARKIVDHYFMREIGFETPGLFKHYVKVTMNEIMERKLPLIYSSAIQYDPLINIDYTEEYQAENTSSGSSSGSSTGNTSGLTVNSDTPQGQISKTAILSGDFASSTSAGESTSSTSDSATSNGSSEQNYTKHIKGNSGVSATAQRMIQQYRDNIIAIDESIIYELSSLFMGIY